MGSPLDIALTIVVLSFWLLFPIAMFLSMSHMDKNTDQIVGLDHLRHHPAAMPAPIKIHKPVWRPYVAVYFRRLLRH